MNEKDHRITDLVARLRDVVPEEATSIGDMWNLIEEAADEIERMRKQLGVLAVLILQNERTETTEWARGVKITFPDGSPQVTL
jgi:hypothetical protein